jgi:hypothetical protein
MRSFKCLALVAEATSMGALMWQQDPGEKMTSAEAATKGCA